MLRLLRYPSTLNPLARLSFGTPVALFARSFPLHSLQLVIGFLLLSFLAIYFGYLPS